MGENMANYDLLQLLQWDLKHWLQKKYENLGYECEVENGQVFLLKEMKMQLHEVICGFEQQTA